MPDSLTPSLSFSRSSLCLSLGPSHTPALVCPRLCRLCREGRCFTPPEGIILLRAYVWGAVVGVPPECTGSSREVMFCCGGDGEGVLPWGKMGATPLTLGDPGSGLLERHGPSLLNTLRWLTRSKSKAPNPPPKGPEGPTGPGPRFFSDDLISYHSPVIMLCQPHHPPHCSSYELARVPLWHFSTGPYLFRGRFSPTCSSLLGFSSNVTTLRFPLPLFLEMLHTLFHCSDLILITAISNT